VQEVNTKGFESTEEIVDNILDCISLAQFDAVAIWRDRTEFERTGQLLLGVLHSPNTRDAAFIKQSLI
jgi:hypothetical protein